MDQTMDRDVGRRGPATAHRGGDAGRHCGGIGRRMRPSLAAASALVLLGMPMGIGCGLLDEATTLTLCADPQHFAVDTAQLGFSASATVLPELPCESATNVCTQLTDGFACDAELWQCSARCTARAGGGSALCGLRAALGRHLDVDIAAHVRNQL
ncbi:MAG: hypothetical protein IPL40_15990 [Proteobacteria bacterium]|nr:hypothetical protein [Pseudomonadota bacterium]